MFFNKLTFALGGKKIVSLLAALVLFVTFLPVAQASVNLTAGPTSLVPTPTSLPNNSNPTALFAFTLSNTAGENLTGVTLQVAPSSSSGGSATQLGAFYLYKDNGSGIFNSSTQNQLGSQANVTASSTVTVAPSVFTSASGKFYIAFGTSLFWNSSITQNSIIVTMPSNSINTSGGMLVTPVTSAAVLTPSSTTLPTLVSAVAEPGNAAGTPGVLVLTFSLPTNKFGLSNANIANQLTLNNGHSLLDSLGNLGTATWSPDGTKLTINLSGPTSTYFATAPTVAAGDTISLAGSNSITDPSGNVSTGSVPITGSFVTQSSNNGLSLNLSSTSVIAGNPVLATATLFNPTSNASGTVTYNFYPNTTCTAPPVFTNAQTVSNAVVPASQNFSSTATGVYSVQASYSGDSSGNTPSVSPCEMLVLSVDQSAATTPAAPSGSSTGSTGLPRTGQEPALLLLLIAAVGAAAAKKIRLI